MSKKYFIDIMFKQGFEIATELIRNTVANSETITVRQWTELDNEIEDEIDRYKNED